MACVVISDLGFALLPHFLFSSLTLFWNSTPPSSKGLACKLCLSLHFLGNWAKAKILMISPVLRQGESPGPQAGDYPE